jgi:hypothetical protein
MPPNENHKKTPACPTAPADTDPAPSPTTAAHAHEPLEAPVATPCAAATAAWAPTAPRYTRADAPALRRLPTAGRTCASLCACAHSTPHAASPTAPTPWCRRARRPHTATTAPNALLHPAKRALGGCLLSSRLSPSDAKQGWHSAPWGRRWAGSEWAHSERWGRCPASRAYKALRPAPSARERSIGGVGYPVDAWGILACAGDGRTVYRDAVGLVWGAVGEGVAQQVFQGSVGVEVALEVSVVAVGDVVGVGALGACELGDGFSCGGDEFGVGELLEGAVGFGSCGVEGCGADEVLEVVYWVCVVVLPIGLSCPVKFVVCHSRDRDTRWAFCCSRGCGCGDVKMADFRVPLAKRGEPAGGQI